MAALMMPPLHRKEKVYRATVCHLTNLTDDELRARYRFGQDSINFIANLLREDLARTTNKATGLTVEEQVKIALRFYASGSRTASGYSRFPRKTRRQKHSRAHCS